MNITILKTNINNVLKKYKVKSFLDLGCGSGRIIDFFNKKLPDKKFIGIEYYQSQFDFCKSNKASNPFESDSKAIFLTCFLCFCWDC